MRRNIFTGLLSSCSPVLRLRGGASSKVLRRSSRISSLPPPQIPPAAPLPLPTNCVTLPIAQINNQSLTVADSSIPGTGRGLFTLQSVDSSEVLCRYSGDHLHASSLPLPDLYPRYDYVWANSSSTVIIDAYAPHSCFGRYANDPIELSLCNAIIVQRGSEVFLVSTRPLLPNEEILVCYGDGY